MRIVSAGIIIGLGALLYASSTPIETKVKAAYLYNFTKFVEWPESKKKPVRICVRGDREVARMLESLAAKQGETIEFSVASASFNPAECHILYLSGPDKEAETLIASLKNQSVLTVSDNRGFLEAGGMVVFFPEGGKIRFGINLPSARNSDLKISSKLLELAKPAR